MLSGTAFDDGDYPGYAEAVAREHSIRSAACLGLNEIICGLEVKPLCAAHWQLLSLVQSPFLRRFTAEQLATKPDILTDIMGFLWIVSPFYEAGSRVSEPRKKSFFGRRIKATARDNFTSSAAIIFNCPVDKVCAEILEYVEQSFVDADESTKSDEKSYYAFELAIASELQEHYGFRLDFWNHPPIENNPLMVPLKLVFQLRKLRAQRAESVVVNKSEKHIREGLDKLQEKLNRDHQTRQYERDLGRASTPTSTVKSFEFDYGLN